MLTRKGAERFFTASPNAADELIRKLQLVLLFVNLYRRSSGNIANLVCYGL